MERVCQEVVHLNNQRLYLKVNLLNADTSNTLDTVAYKQKLAKLDTLIDGKLQECKTLSRKANHSLDVLSFMYYVGEQNKKDELRKNQSVNGIISE
ncbi:MAG: hypothetical protein HQK83_03165 [Fibrobacteria bacterium]|nr:hypothetical protein [Fibrobacteria bacterium]